LIEFGWFKSFGCLDCVQEVGGVEDEVEGFSCICWVSQEGSSRELIHFFPLKTCHGCCAPDLLSFLDAHKPLFSNFELIFFVMGLTACPLLLG
jgi:hypothetical protein